LLAVSRASSTAGQPRSTSCPSDHGADRSQYLTRPLLRSRRWQPCWRPRVTRQTQGVCNLLMRLSGGGGPITAKHEQAGGCAQGLPNLLADLDRTGQPGLGLGHHLYPDGQGLSLSGVASWTGHSPSGACVALSNTLGRRILASRSCKRLWHFIGKPEIFKHGPEPPTEGWGRRKIHRTEFPRARALRGSISRDGKGRCWTTSSSRRLWGSLNYRRSSARLCQLSPRRKPDRQLVRFYTEGGSTRSSAIARSPKSYGGMPVDIWTIGSPTGLRSLVS